MVRKALSVWQEDLKGVVIMRDIKWWGQVLSTREHLEFGKLTLAATGGLIGRMAELSLLPMELDTVDADFEGNSTREKLVITESGLKAIYHWWEQDGGLFGWDWLARLHLYKGLSRSAELDLTGLGDNKLADLLERHLFALGDIEEMLQVMDLLQSLRELVVLSAKSELIRPLKIKEAEQQVTAGSVITKRTLELTAAGLVFQNSYMDAYGRWSGESSIFKNPTEVTYCQTRDWFGKPFELTVKEVKKARQKLLEVA